MFRRYFEHSTDACFRTLDDGQTAFYPAGLFGRKGYLVDSPETERRLRNAVKRSNWVGIVVGGTFGIAISFIFQSLLLSSALTAIELFGLLVVAFVLIFGIGGLGTMSYFRIHTQGLARASFPNSSRAHLYRIYGTLNPRLLRSFRIFLGVVTAICLVAGILLSNLPYLLLAAVFGCFSVLLPAMLRSFSAHSGDTEN